MNGLSWHCFTAPEIVIHESHIPLKKIEVCVYHGAVTSTSQAILCKDIGEKANI